MAIVLRKICDVHNDRGVEVLGVSVTWEGKVAELCEGCLIEHRVADLDNLMAAFGRPVDEVDAEAEPEPLVLAKPAAKRRTRKTRSREVRPTSTMPVLSYTEVMDEFRCPYGCHPGRRGGRYANERGLRKHMTRAATLGQHPSFEDWLKEVGRPRSA